MAQAIQVLGKRATRIRKAPVCGTKGTATREIFYIVQNGLGSCTWSRSSSEKGNWEMGNMQGEGEFTFAVGERHTGN